jgi:phage gp46-like protein
MTYCHPSIPKVVRGFWTTQPYACGTNTTGYCSRNECGVPGLDLITSPDGATFNNKSWLNSLIYNIISTNGKLNSDKCNIGFVDLNGYWADSYRDDNKATGITIGNVSNKLPMRELMELIKSYLERDMQKLIAYKVADKVTITSKYLGNNKFSMIINVFKNGDSLSNTFNGCRHNNKWTWEL